MSDERVVEAAKEAVLAWFGQHDYTNQRLTDGMLALAAAVHALEEHQPEPAPDVAEGQSVPLALLKAAGWEVAMHNNGASALWRRRPRRLVGVFYSKFDAWAEAARLEAARKGAEHAE